MASKNLSPLHMSKVGRINSARNSFDLGYHSYFTQPAGMLLPCYVQDIVPGDYLKLHVQNFCRTHPVNTAAFSRYKQITDF